MHKIMGTLEYQFIIDNANIFRIFVGEKCVSRMEIVGRAWKTYDNRTHDVSIPVEQIAEIELINLGYIMQNDKL